VTNIEGGSAEWLCDTLYCARGQAENLIKLHKGQLASDRTSCRSPLANQVRRVLHTGAYWLMLGLRDAIPKPQPLARAEFTTLRMRLIKIGARIAETDRQQGPHRFCGRTSRGRAVRQSRPLPPTRRPLTHGPSAPNSPGRFNLQRLPDMSRSAMKKAHQGTAFDPQKAAGLNACRVEDGRGR